MYQNIISGALLIRDPNRVVSNDSAECLYEFTSGLKHKFGYLAKAFVFQSVIIYNLG